MTTLDITELQLRLRFGQFAGERDWNRFHTPKNLAMALAGEAGELSAVLQSVEGPASAAAARSDGVLRAEFTDEMADVMIYLGRLADVTDLDLDAEVEAERRPAEPGFRRRLARAKPSKRSLPCLPLFR